MGATEFLLLGEHIERIDEAIAAGEILRVRYDRGSQPGTVRDIRPLKVLVDKLAAYDGFSRIPKSFLLNFLWLAPIDSELTYVPRRQSRRVVDPTTMTAGWAFSVHVPPFADVLDIRMSVRRNYDLKTQTPRLTCCFTQSDPAQYHFAEGDCFHLGGPRIDGAWGAIPQHIVIRVTATDDDIAIIDILHFRFGAIVHERRSIRIAMEKLGELLRFGKDCPDGKRLL